MKALKEFFNKETILKCFIFALIVSLMFTWRLTHVKNIPFFSADTFHVYLFFTAANFVVFMLMFLALFLLARRKQEFDEDR